MRAPAERFVFLHIPKCAGSSMHDALVKGFDRSTVYPRYGQDVVRDPIAELRRWRYLAGHFSKLGVDRIPGPKWMVTALRDPKARVLSLYYFWRSFTDAHVEAKNLRGPRLAKSMGLIEFLRSDERFIIHNVRNAQVRTLIGPMQMTPDSDPYDEPWMVDVAFGNLLRFNYVAFAETLDEDLPEICARFGLPAPEETPRKNAFGEVNPAVAERIEKEPMTAEVEAALAEHTRLDQALYDRAFAVRPMLRSPYPA